MADERDERVENPDDAGEGMDDLVGDDEVNGSEQPEVDAVDDGDEQPDVDAVGEDDGQPTDEDSDRAMESLRELVTYLVHNLVDEPETVEILVERRGPSVQVQLRLPEGEMGKVIGRGGRIAKAIRTVLLIAGSRHHLRVSLDIES